MTVWTWGGGAVFGWCLHTGFFFYLLVNETEEGDADLHTQVVQAEDGRL